jgi:dipeptidyl aminopeptidase/acylaminoacyl peptidase
MSDPRDDKLAAMLATAWGTPRPGWDARALAALADVRPRRHPNLLTHIIVAALLLLLAAGVFAAVRHFYVEGTLHFHEYRGTLQEPQEPTARFFGGELEWESDAWPSETGDIAPVSGKAVSSWQDAWPPTRTEINVHNLDWSDEVVLTEIAGIGGINCKPKWSPDETMIAFQHCDPVQGLLPCRAGFHLWVMNADGSDAHRVMPEGGIPTGSATWSPDGSRLLTYMGESNWYGHWYGEQISAISTDIWGTDIQALPNVGWSASWSPDGSMIVSEYAEKGEFDGQEGRWNQLLLTNADGSAPRVLVEQFIAEGDIRARDPIEDQLAAFPNAELGIKDVQYWAGPRKPVWSPNSDKIAFLAALPFDRDGPFAKDQIEVWVYDLTTDELIRVTNDDIMQSNIIWK